MSSDTDTVSASSSEKSVTLSENEMPEAKVEVEINVIPVATQAMTPVPTPTPLPTDTPTPSPTPSPEPTATPDPNRKMVALTFDDGPNPDYTMKFLDVLEKYQAVGTFFVIGYRLNDPSAPATIQRMADMGCDIGIHGLTHDKMTNYSRSKNVSRFNTMKERISSMVEGGYTPHLMRPPYGTMNSTVLRAAKETELACIRWSIDTLDWSNHNASKVIKTVQEEVKDGSIILFHDRLDCSLEAIDVLIPWLREQGYDIVTVTELLESAGPIEYG